MQEIEFYYGPLTYWRHIHFKFRREVAKANSRTLVLLSPIIATLVFLYVVVAQRKYRLFLSNFKVRLSGSDIQFRLRRDWTSLPWSDVRSVVDTGWEYILDFDDFDLPLLKKAMSKEVEGKLKGSLAKFGLAVGVNG